MKKTFMHFDVVHERETDKQTNRHSMTFRLWCHTAEFRQAGSPFDPQSGVT